MRNVIKKRSYGGLKSQDVEKMQMFEVVSENDPLGGSFQNSVLKGFIATFVDLLCSNFVKFGRREVGEIVRCLPQKNKTSPGSPVLAIARIAPKICQGHSPTHENILRVLQISSKSVHFRQSYSRTREYRQSTIESENRLKAET